MIWQFHTIVCAGIAILSFTANAALFEFETKKSGKDLIYTLKNKETAWTVSRKNEKSLNVLIEAAQKKSEKVFAFESPILSDLQIAEFANGKQLLVIKGAGWNSQQSVFVFDPTGTNLKPLFSENFPSEAQVAMETGDKGIKITFKAANGKLQLRSWSPK